MVGGASKQAESKQWLRGNHGNPDKAHHPGTEKQSGKP